MIDLNPDNLETSINVGNLGLNVKHCHLLTVDAGITLSLRNDDNYVGSEEGRVTVSQPNSC